MASPAIRSSLSIVERAKTAQAAWAETTVAERLTLVRKLRHQLAESAADFLPLFPDSLVRAQVDSLTAEILPLIDACRFLELQAAHILAPQQLAKSGRPWLSRSVAIHVRHDPFGVILVIAPGNYPLFLPAVQAIQGLVAGNAIIWKPGRGGRPIANAFELLARACGLPDDLLQITDESIAAATSTIASGVDKIFLTGSLESGQAVLRAAADPVTPVVVELSGRDAVIVLASANADRAARAIVFGLKLNDGNTCIAPRRIFAHQDVAASLEFRLQMHAGDNLSVPRISIFDNEEAMLALVNRQAFGLGATVFGEMVAARRIANKIAAGVVVLNDMIVPTADPRVPFGGRKMSGFGTTRGAQGLLEMTTLKAVVEQQSRRLRHLEPLPREARNLFLYYITGVHSSTAKLRLRSWACLSRLLLNLRKAQT